MNLSQEQINEIAELLDCGLICYVNKDTKEIKSVIDSDQFYDDLALWDETLKEIDDNFDKYLKIEKMSSREAYQIMEQFAGTVEDKEIRKKLTSALGRRKPFQNFKYEVDENEAVRQEWFTFKAHKYQEWVKTELDNHNASNSETPTFMGYYDDDGNKYDPNLHPLPNLCLSCQKRNDPNEEVLCNLTRLDQLGEEEFNCFAYKALKK